MYCVEDMYFIRQIEDTTHSQYIILMRIPSGSSGSGSSSSSDGLCVFSSPTSFLRSLPCFSKGSIPLFLDEEVGWQAFNASMHSIYGYKGLDKPFTTTDFKHLVDYHNNLDDRCKWMTEKWIDLLEPLQIGMYRQMYTTYNNMQKERQLDREERQLDSYCIEQQIDREIVRQRGGGGGGRHRQMYTTWNNRQRDSNIERRRRRQVTLILFTASYFYHLFFSLLFHHLLHLDLFNQLIIFYFL